MVKAKEFNLPEYLSRRVKLYMKDGTVDVGIFLSYDSIRDNDEGDGFVLDIDGDTTVGRLVLEKDVERVEFE